MVNYYVRVYNIKASNLSLKKESNQPIDPYVKFFFNENKKIKTETLAKTNNPSFKFDHSFIFQTGGKTNTIDSKNLEVEAYDSCLLGSDTFIGGFSIDYKTIITGPVHHRVVIRNQGKPTGTVEFDLEMAELNETLMTFKNIRANFYPGALSHVDLANEKFLHYHIDDSQPGQQKSNNITYTQKNGPNWKSKKSTSLIWEDIDQIMVETTLKNLLSNPIVFSVCQVKKYDHTDPSYGQAYVSLSSFVSNLSQIQDNQKISFVESIMHQQMVVGVLEGDIYFNNASLTCQMIGGVHTDVGIQDGQVLYGGSVSTTAQAVTTPVATIEEKQVLPEGWEMRIDPSGKQYYVDHNTKTSHWNLPSTLVTPPPPATLVDTTPLSSSVPLPTSVPSVPTTTTTAPIITPVAPQPTTTTVSAPISASAPSSVPVFTTPITPTTPVPTNKPSIEIKPTVPVQPQQQQVMGQQPIYPQQPGLPYQMPNYMTPQQQQQYYYQQQVLQQQQQYRTVYPQQQYYYYANSGSNCHGHHHCH